MGFDDLANKAGTKLLNCFYVQAEVKKQEGKEFYRYCKVMMLQSFNFDGFLTEIEKGNILVDFDARTQPWNQVPNATELFTISI